LIGVLEDLRPLLSLPLAGYSGESIPPANSGSVSAPPAAASISVGVRLPEMPVAALLYGVPMAPQALSGIGESFTLADMEPAICAPEPIPPQLGWMLPKPGSANLATASLQASAPRVPDLRCNVRDPGPDTFAPAPLQYVLPILGELGKPDISEIESEEFACSVAGWAAEESPSPFFGIFRPLYDSCDFSLQPVWLASLFRLGHLFCGPRLCGARNPGAIGSRARFNGVPAHDDGPGFSGTLMLPRSCAPAWEFGEERTPGAPRPLDPRDVPLPKNPWQDALRFWRSIPGFARGLAVAIPLIAPAMFYAPTINVPNISTSQGTLMAAIQARAAVDLQEDFQAGLGAWTGTTGWESTWLLTSPGAVQPGRLALYKPMTPLSDYNLEIHGQIQSKALSFVFRATDMNNYYAAKIVVRKPGPLPSVYLVRYAVINGRADQKTETLLPMYLRTDTLYDMLVTAQGENFTITVNGQLVETWSDSRLKSGGVGLFAEKDEISQIRFVHVTENEDFLGRICSQVSLWNADRARIGVKNE
jgi:hypothetical protein